MKVGDLLPETFLSETLSTGRAHFSVRKEYRQRNSDDTTPGLSVLMERVNQQSHEVGHDSVG
jgi:hypothetical protein